MNKKKLGGFLAALAGIAATVLAVKGGGSKPTPPAPAPPIVAPPYTLIVHVCDGPCSQDEKVPDVEVALDTHRVLRTGGSGDVDFPDTTPGPHELCSEPTGYARACLSVNADQADHNQHVNLELARLVPPTLAVRVDGRFWVTDAGTFRPLFQSGLALLARGPPERAAFLDQTRALGFNGIRVFAGDLGWANQTPASARAALPALLDEAAARGLYVYVCALTGGGYDVEAHLRAIVEIVKGRSNVLLEGFNELGHPTQSDIGKDPARALQLTRRVIPPGITWTLGAMVGTDEPTPEGTYAADGGLFNDGHLDRGRDLYNQVRRLREIYGIAESTRKPAMSGEPIGIAEVPMPGKQRFWNGRDEITVKLFGFPDAATRFSFAYGVLCRGLEVGCVFHSEQGLHGEPLGPNTTAAAREFLAGWQAIPTTDRLTFVNAGWAGSPVAGADFDNGIVRAYSFIAGGRGWTVLVGVRGDPRVVWGGGWRPVGVIAERPGVQVIEITK